MFKKYIKTDSLEAVEKLTEKYDYFRHIVNNNTMLFRMGSEVPPVQPIRLKVEINCFEHFSPHPEEGESA